MLSVVLTVSTHARIWVTTYYSCICQARVHDTRNGWKKHACSCKPKCTSAVRGKTCVLVQTKSTSAVRGNQRYTRAVRANHDAHGSRLTSRVYTRALDVHFHVIDLSCTRRLCCEYFQKRVESCSCLTRV